MLNRDWVEGSGFSVSLEQSGSDQNENEVSAASKHRAVRWMEAHSLWLILLLGLLMRLPGLISKPLWYDEAFAVLFSAQGPLAMAYGTLLVDQGVAADVHPLGYYTLLWLWQAIAGAAPLAVRSLSVVLGLVVIYLGYTVSRRLFNRRIAITSAALLALSPFQIHYAQEVRMYALLAVLLLGATYVYWRALEGGSTRDWVVFALLAAAAQYTHTLAALYLLPLGLTPLWCREWTNFKKTLYAGLLATLLYLPWLVYVPSQLSRVRWAYWIPQPGLAELVRTWLVFTSGLPVPRALLALVLFGAVLVATLAVWGTVRAQRAQDETFPRGSWLLYLAAAPVTLMFALSYWQPVYLERALLTSGAAFLLWIGWALSGPRLNRLYAWTGRGALLVSYAIGLFGYYSYRGFPFAPWESMNEAVTAERQPLEVLLHSNKITAIPAHYYDPNLNHRYLPDPPASSSDTLAPATQEVLGFFAESTLEAAVSDASGVWFVLFSREVEDYRAEGFEAHPALEELFELFTLESTSNYGDLEVYHFVK